ncbi:hypothetical protein OTB20_14620 [Streptomyces sp. H27-H1]|uniref:hypothetical protein n=1 Tax=Streptomyces sp. H27-H1 TaxID=2996461 RepID=UPI00227004AA|nr:hypothetical protein [Streptomyces sp. H27-H1]MCY0927422.1 hypothetical protein [Streptomyces sp. H27-H1]
MRGPQMYVASSQPADRPSSVRGIGAWPTPAGAMARARHRVRRTGLGGERVLALAPGRPGEVDVLTRSAYWSYLWRLDGRARRSGMGARS